jgi:hypothetical protein
LTILLANNPTKKQINLGAQGSVGTTPIHPELGGEKAEGT